MSIKQQLIEAAKTINTAVELDSIFESADLSAEMKANFKTVFESAVKSTAIKLAEDHVNMIATKSEELVETKVQEEMGELTETLNMYLEHVSKHWLEENKIAVSNNIKIDMFESLMVGMKDLFVDHNVVIPEEAVNVVEELEAEIAEAREELNVAIQENKNLQESVSVIKRDSVVENAIANLAESQKEKVKNLVEGLEYNELFESKLTAIVEMTAPKAVVESTVEDSAEVTTIAEQADPNFVAESQIDESTKVDPAMAAYLAAL